MPEKNLGQITVGEMVKNRDVIYSVAVSDSAKEAASTLRRLKIRATGVLENGKLVGIVSHYDVSTKIVVEGKDPDKVGVAEIMTPEVVTVRLFNTFSECLELFERHNISHLVVEDRKGNYHGVLSCRDMQSRMLENLRYQLDVTRQYAFGPDSPERGK